MIANGVVALFLNLLMMVQAVPGLPGQTGSVSGVLKTATGTPAIGIRVAAMAPPESAATIAISSALAAISETDATGRYRIDGIPPGRYFIVAGRVDQPTFYPGTLDVARGTIVPVAAGTTSSNVDFALNDTSIRTADSFSNAPRAEVLLPMNVHVENESKVPLFGPNGLTAFRLTRTADGAKTEALLNSFNIRLADITAEYRASVENMPDGFVVKSINLGSLDLTNGTLKVAVSTSTSAVSAAAAGVVSITLSAVPDSKPHSGVRLTGDAGGTNFTSLSLSGIPGIFFSDGSFEFRDVSPGRYTILALKGNPLTTNARVASVVVGNRTVDGIHLEETPVLPVGFQLPLVPAPTDAHADGIVPLHSIRGRIVEDGTQEPITNGTVFLVGDHFAPAELDADGRFEFSHLLSGTYEVDMLLVGYKTFQQNVVVGENDVQLNLSPP